jgi:hypothetical protein
MKLSLRIGLIVLLAGFAAAGCKPSCADHCGAAEECEGDGEEEDCLRECEQEEQRAEKAGCDTEFDDLVACVVDKGECEGEGEKDYDVRGCEAEEDALEQCDPE